MLQCVAVCCSVLQCVSIRYVCVSVEFVCLLSFGAQERLPPLPVSDSFIYACHDSFIYVCHDSFIYACHDSFFIVCHDSSVSVKFLCLLSLCICWVFVPTKDFHHFLWLRYKGALLQNMVSFIGLFWKETCNLCVCWVFVLTKDFHHFLWLRCKGAVLQNFVSYTGLFCKKDL